MRRRKFLFLCFVVLSLEILCGTRNYSSDDLKRRTRTGETIMEETATESNSNDTDKINERRLESLVKACKRLGYTEANYTINIRAHMSPNKNTLYCRVNKCASTTTLEVMKRLFNCDTDCQVKVAAMVKANVNASKIMNDAFSFMVVREPYGRLFSTYCNIFYFPKEDWFYRGVKIIKLARPNISSDSLNFGHDLTFAELVKYIIESYENGLRLDEHVRPIHHKSCNPCMFRFDYIAHLETFEKDFQFILKTMQSRNIIENYPKDLAKSLREWTLFGPVKHLFKTLLLVKASTLSTYNIFLRAWSYYQITGHVSKNIDFPYSEEDVTEINKETFIQALKTAIESSAKYNSDLHKQRYDAMIQAYSSVSTEHLERLRKVVATDCFLFGYENSPNYLFDRNRLLSNKEVDTFNFFKGL
ncbi:carbohydrate sulfotransferase 13-like [Mercenaria mercenaria]|uniref:carbohydrate sulfotransferase 13-like n=1 Tax=Mercenaria mercenaria TaxID=6596 RepID=UPI001E1E1B3E|nr:carbohydrate sulfotransferase 13-like [Mercenaria mercenaria]